MSRAMVFGPGDVWLILVAGGGVAGGDLPTYPRLLLDWNGLSGVRSISNSALAERVSADRSMDRAGVEWMWMAMAFWDYVGGRYGHYLHGGGEWCIGWDEKTSEEIEVIRGWTVFVYRNMVKDSWPEGGFGDGSNVDEGKLIG